ncbi:MAG: protease pro-enzyme activation domain-containing protein, partial [Polyangiales bacterium]
MKTAHLSASILIACSTLTACAVSPTASPTAPATAPAAASNDAPHAPGAASDAPTVGAPRRQLTGHIGDAIRRAPVVDRLASNTEMRLTIGLPVRDEAALEAELAQITDPSSPSFRRYLSHEQFAEKYGPSAADYDAVMAWAKAHGLQATAHPDRVFIKVQGVARDVEAAFGVHLVVGLRPDGTRFYAPDAEPSVDLDVPILHVSHLNDYEVMAASTLPAEASGAITSAQVRAAYAGTSPLNGAGQTIGIFAFGNLFLQSDITSFDGAAGINPPTVQRRGPAATSTVWQNEISLDIEVAQSVAPAAQIVVFNGSTDEIMANMTADTSIAQFSSSFFPSIDSGEGSDPNLLQGLHLFAAHGQTFFNCSGDGGAYPANTWTNLNDVRAQPFV